MKWFKNPAKKPALTPLPVGLEGFNNWSDRIIERAGLPSTRESQKYALAHMITTLPQGVCEESEDYFVTSLRRAASNQCAIYYREKIYPEVKARLAREEKEAQEKQQGEATPTPGADGKVLDIKRV